MTKIIDRTGKGSALSLADNDANLDSLSSITESITGPYTVTIDDQNRLLQISSASAVPITLTAISTIITSLHTTSFRTIIKNIGAGLVTITCGGTDTFVRHIICLNYRTSKL